MNSLQVIFTLGLIVIVSSLPIEFTHDITHGDLKLTVNDIFAEINEVLKRDLNEQLNKDPIDFGDKVNTTTSDGGKLQVQVQHFNSANGFPVFFKPSDDQILDDKKVSQVVEKVDDHATETSTSVTFSSSLTQSSSAPNIDVSKSIESTSTTSAPTTTTTKVSAKVSDISKSTESTSTTSAPTSTTTKVSDVSKVSYAAKSTESVSITTTVNSVSSLETVSTSSVAPIITIVLPEKVSGDSITKAPIVARSLDQSTSTTTVIPLTTRLSSSAAGTVSTSSVVPVKVFEVSTESVSTTVAPSTTTTKAPETTTSGNIFLEAFDSIASFFQSKPESPVTTTHAPTTTVAATTSTGSVSVSTSTKQSDVAEVPSTSNSPIVQIVELKKDISAVPVIFTQV